MKMFGSHPSIVEIQSSKVILYNSSGNGNYKFYLNLIRIFVYLRTLGGL